MSDQTQFRWLDQQIISSGAFLLAGLSIISEAYVGPSDYDVVGLVLASAMFALGARLACNGAVGTKTGLKIRNLSRTVFLPWDEIDRFEVGRLRPFGFDVATAITKSGQAVRLSSFFAMAPTPIAMRRIERLLERLENEKTRRQTERGTS
jgi:hypothetical protein